MGTGLVLCHVRTCIILTCTSKVHVVLIGDAWAMYSGGVLTACLLIVLGCCKCCELPFLAVPTHSRPFRGARRQR